MKTAKIIAGLTATVAAAVMFTLAAAADRLSDNGKPIELGMSYVREVTDNPDTATYKFTIPEKAAYDVKFEIEADSSNVHIYNTEGAEFFVAKDAKLNSGSYEYNMSNGIDGFRWNNNTQKVNGTNSVVLDPGTYFITFDIYDNWSQMKIKSGKVTFSITNPKPKPAPVPATPAPAKPPVLTTTLAKGATAQFGSIQSDGNPTAAATWASSKAEVASVDKNGTVTAKKKGQTTVTAKIGASVLKFVVKVA